MFKRNLDSKCKVQNDSIKSENMRNRKIAIDKQKIISIAMILTVISIFISYNVFLEIMRYMHFLNMVLEEKK